MPCLDLKKLLPHRKVWKMLTNRLPLKLMMRLKANKKHKNKSKSYKTCKKLALPSLSIQPKKFKKKPNSHTLIHHRKNHHRCFQKRAPVFVDHLFVEPVSVVREHVIPSRDPILKEKSSQLDSTSDQIHRPESSEGGEISEIVVSGDDVWESMVLGSPQMNEINERADEFIARFRAQMNRQEMLARSL
ncbi:hypothetical protein ACS0TY_013184 [Phlomoides rotata]